MYDYYYNDGLRWLINDVEHAYIMMMYLFYIIDCYIVCSRSGWSTLFMYNEYDKNDYNKILKLRIYS
jgi:hypothetical protein